MSFKSHPLIEQQQHKTNKHMTVKELIKHLELTYNPDDVIAYDLWSVDDVIEEGNHRHSADTAGLRHEKSMKPESNTEAVETTQTTNVSAVDLPRLVRLYDWLRVEEQHGETIACGGIFPAEEIKEGQRWQESSGHTVTVENVNDHSVHYSWVERGTKMAHNKAHFAFQCRYCLILPNNNNNTKQINI